jgi:hypothetical protein
MSFKDNNCPNCTNDRMCPRCEIEMLEHDILRAMTRIEELKKKEKINVPQYRSQKTKPKSHY